MNALLPIEVKLADSETDLKAKQLVNVLSPIEVILSGILTDVNSVHALKALDAMPVTEYVVSSNVTDSGIVISPVYFPVLKRTTLTSAGFSDVTK